MRIIRIFEGQYVRAKAIHMIKAELGLAAKAPTDVRTAWEAGLENPDNYFQNMLLPTIKVVLVANEETMLYFSSDEARDKHLAELIAEWKGK